MAERDEIAARVLANRRRARGESPAAVGTGPVQTDAQSISARVLANRRERRAVEAHVNVLSFTGTSPDTYVRAREAAARAGMPVESALRDLDGAERAARSNEIDFDRLAQDNPATTRLLGDPQRAPIVHDDVEQLSAWETAARRLIRPVRSAAAGVSFDLSAAIWGLAETGAKLGADIIEPAARALLPENPLRRAGERLEFYRKSAQFHAGELAGEPLPDEGLIERSINQGFRSVGQMAPGLAATLYTGNPAFALSAAGGTAGSQAATQGLDAGLAPWHAAIYGGEDAAAEVITELLPVGALLRGVKASDPFWKLIGTQILTQVPTEAVATAWQGFNQWANVNPDKPFSDYIDAQPEAQAETLIATLTASILTAGFGSAAISMAGRAEQRAQQAQGATATAEQLAELADIAEQSKLKQRDVEQARAFFQEVLEDGSDSVWIAPERLAESGMAETLAAVSPEIAEQLAQPTAGHDIRLPVADLMAHLPGPTLMQEVIPHVSAEPGGFTATTAQEYLASEQGSELQEEVAAAIEREQQDAQTSAEVDQIRKQIKSQLEDVGRFDSAAHDAYARLVAAFYATQAQRAGISPFELYQRYPLRVAGTQAEADSKRLFQPGVRGTFRPDSVTIELLKNADLSTFLHETGHAFLEMQLDLTRATAQQEELQPGEQSLSDDTQTLLDWFGVESMDAWNGLSDEQRRVHHETFARGFEAYLRSGKAPSIEMSGMFRRFRAWLTQIYRDIQTLGVRLTPDVRGVMDRLIASAQQIEQAQRARSMAPLFENAEQAGMSAQEWASYQALGAQAEATAVDALASAGVRDLQWLDRTRSRALKDLSREAKALRREASDEVRAELLKDPVYQVQDYLTRKRPKTESDPPAGRLHEGSLREALDGDPDADAIIDQLREAGMVVKRSDYGVSPDAVAALFPGFESASEMVRAIAAAEPLRDAVAARVDQLMIERHGELSTPEAIAEAADAAIHNDVRSRFVAREAQALSNAIGRPSLLNPAARRFAREMVERQPIRRIRPDQYAAGQARAAKAAQEAAAKSDIATAAAEKRNELILTHATRQAYEARAEVGKTFSTLRRLTDPRRMVKTLGQDYADQINALMSRHSVRSIEPSGPIEPLADFIERASDDLSAVRPDIPSWLSSGADQRHWRDLTAPELRDLLDTVRQLRRLANREQEQYQAVRNQSFQDEVDSILAELKAAHPEAFDGDVPIKYRKDNLPLMAEWRQSFRSGFDSELVSFENMLDVMTRGKGRAIFESLFGRLSDAADKQTAMMRDLGRFLRENTRAYSPKERVDMMLKKRLVPGTGGRYMTREQRIAVALFNGSAEGRQRLIDGNELSPSQIDAIIDTLDEKDVQLIRAFWRMSDEMIWPELQALNQRTTGSAPPKVEATPFETRHGTVPGGYVPLVYDGDLDTRAHDLNSNATVQDLLGGTANAAATARSASKARLNRVNRALDLSLRAMSSKIGETVHDITHREAVADTYRLLQDKSRLSHALRNIAGPRAYNAMLKRVREVASKPQTPTGAFERTLWTLRKNTLVAMMGASFNTVAINVLGATPAMRRVGPARFISALRRATTDQPRQRYEWVLDRSEYMRQRLNSFDRDMAQELNRLNPRSLMPSLQFWFAGLAVMDRAVTIPAWIAAYEQGMELHQNDEQAAVAHADRVIRQTQGSGRPVDLSQIAGGVGAAGEFKRAFTMFYNFFNAQLGMLRRSSAVSAGLWSDKKQAQAAAALALDVLAVIVIPATLEAMARGQCDEDDSLAGCAGRASSMFASSMFPLVRDFVPFVWRQFDPEFKGGFRMQLSPIESALDTVGRMPKSVYDVAAGEDNETDIRTLVRGTGYLFGLPGFQGWRTIEGYRALMDGETSNPAVLLTGYSE